MIVRPGGERCRAAVPHGHWKTTTFTRRAVRYDGIAAPMILDGPMNGEAFLAYVEQALAPAVAATRHRHHGQSASPPRSMASRQAIEAAGASLRITCRRTVPTSTPSNKPSPNSRPCCSAAAPREPSLTSGKPLPALFAASPRKNVPTTSPPQDTMQHERNML